jgi:outer membrane protein OmpA-like peptidoglycan-associated protein
MKKLEYEIIVGVSEKPVVFESSQPGIDISNLPELKSGTVLTVYGSVLNNNSDEPLQARIEVKGENYSNQFLAEINGNYSVKLPKSQYDVFELVFSAEGYLSRSEEIKVNPDEDLLALSVALYPVELGSVVNLDNVNFYRGTADLIEFSYKQLQIIAQLLLDNPNMEIELSGHTDNQGNSKLNLKLSQDRVDKVKEYLIANGISANRISGRGYGGTQPITSNASEETRKFNRRVEFIIVRN